MAVTKTARIQPDIKEHAKTFATRDSLPEAEFDIIMAEGLKQAREDNSISVSETFGKLRASI
ncbi:MAG: hypothetical protein ACI4D0_05820 [Lachnospira sp.]